MPYTFEDNTYHEGEWYVVQEKRKLKQLAKKGFIEFPTKWGGGLQVSEGPKNLREFEHYEPSWHLELKYKIKYVDGSIYPFLFVKKPQYRYTASYQYTY